MSTDMKCMHWSAARQRPGPRGPEALYSYGGTRAVGGVVQGPKGPKMGFTRSNTIKRVDAPYNQRMTCPKDPKMGFTYSMSSARIHRENKARRKQAEHEAQVMATQGWMRQRERHRR